MYWGRITILPYWVLLCKIMKGLYAHSDIFKFLFQYTLSFSRKRDCLPFINSISRYLVLWVTVRNGIFPNFITDWLLQCIEIQLTFIRSCFYLANLLTSAQILYFICRFLGFLCKITVDPWTTGIWSA